MSQGGAPLYYYRSEGQEDGPVSPEKLLELFETHMITAYDEVRRDGETQWQAVQPVVTAILEQKKAGGRRATNTASAPSTNGSAPANDGARAPAREQNLLVAQRGAPAPKPAGSISDEDLAQSIAYANAEVKRGWMLRGALTFTLLGVAAGLAVHYSATLHGTPALDTSWQVDTSLTIDAAAAKMSSPRGTWPGTATVKLTRVREVTYGSDGTVSMAFRDESSRVQADLEGGPDHSELKQGALRGRAVTFSPGETGWSTTLVGAAPSAKQALKLSALAFDNGAFYPERRMWPWPWQSWDVKEPQSCSVLALDLEECKGEVKLRFVGFATCGAERCARLTFAGEWQGQSEGDHVNLTLSGEVLRSLSSRTDVAVNGEGTLAVRRTSTGTTSSNHLELSGHVVYAQQTTPAQ